MKSQENPTCLSITLLPQCLFLCLPNSPALPPLIPSGQQPCISFVSCCCTGVQELCVPDFLGKFCPHDVLLSPSTVLLWQAVTAPHRQAFQAQRIKQMTDICFLAQRPADTGSQFFSLPQTRGGWLGVSALIAGCSGSHLGAARLEAPLCFMRGSWAWCIPSWAELLQCRALEATQTPHLGCTLRVSRFLLGLLYFMMADSRAKSYLMLCEMLSCAQEEQGLLRRAWPGAGTESVTSAAAATAIKAQCRTHLRAAGSIF